MLSVLDSAHCSQTASRGGLRVTVVRGRHTPPRAAENDNKTDRRFCTFFGIRIINHNTALAGLWSFGSPVLETKRHSKTARDADLESDDSSGGEEEEEEEGGEEEEEEGGEGERGERNTRPCYIDARLNGVPAGEAGAQVVGRVEGGREGRTECGRHCSGLEGRRDREED